jgi:hypothetical protein
MVVMNWTLIVFPELGGVVGMAYMAPMFFYEVGLGGWLWLRGYDSLRWRENR